MQQRTTIRIASCLGTEICQLRVRYLGRLQVSQFDPTSLRSNSAKSPFRILSLFDRPRAGDEDIHQSPGALLPVRVGRHVGDADQSPKQIDGSRSLRMSPLLIARFTSARIASLDLSVGDLRNIFEGPPTSVFSAGAMICFVAM